MPIDLAKDRPRSVPLADTLGGALSGRVAALFKGRLNGGSVLPASRRQFIKGAALLSSAAPQADRAFKKVGFNKVSSELFPMRVFTSPSDAGPDIYF